MICAPDCTCWMGTLPCARHGVEPREHHSCADGTRRGGKADDCVICLGAIVDAGMRAGGSDE